MWLAISYATVYCVQFLVAGVLRPRTSGWENLKRVLVPFLTFIAILLALGENKSAVAAAILTGMGAVIITVDGTVVVGTMVRTRLYGESAPPDADGATMTEMESALIPAPVTNANVTALFEDAIPPSDGPPGRKDALPPVPKKPPAFDLADL